MPYISPRREKMTQTIACRDCGGRYEPTKGYPGLPLCQPCGQAQKARGRELAPPERRVWEDWKQYGRPLPPDYEYLAADLQPAA